MDRLASQRVRNHRLWAARRAAGLCGRCGQVKTERYAKCALCREFFCEWKKKWWTHAKWRVNAQRRAKYAA